MKILLSGPVWPEASAILESTGGAVSTLPDSDFEKHLEEIRTADIFLLRTEKLSGDIIRRLPNLKAIARPGAGFDNVDLPAATEMGVPVVLSSGSNAQSVAEHNLALMFALSKRLVELHESIGKGQFSVRNDARPVELLGKTVGIIGLGAIGKKLAALCNAIGMRCIGYDPLVTEGQMAEMGVAYSPTVEQMLPVCDYVAVNVPLNSQTRDLIGAGQLAAMKPSAYLISCGRGGVVSEPALIKALEQGTISGAGLDVFVHEPLPADDPLLKAPHLIMTPHMAGVTAESIVRMVAECMEGCLLVLEGKSWPRTANPEVYETEAWKRKAVQ